MSFKTLFDKATQVSALANKSAADIGAEIESVEYHQQDIIHEKRFIPNVNFDDPTTFARYGSAEEYYVQSLERVYDTYPYDGSRKERLEWENDSTYIDLYLFDNLYPRTNGYVLISATGVSFKGISSDDYGEPTTLEYISLQGGPHPNPAGATPYAGQFTGSNYYNTNTNRGSNLQLNFATDGVTVEFWLKKDQFYPAATPKEVIFDLWNGEASSSADYARLTVELSGTSDGLNPVLLTAQSGAVGVVTASVAASAFTTASLADNKWHHYALSIKQRPNTRLIQTRFYVDGDLNNEQSHTSLSGGVDAGVPLLDAPQTNLRAYIGALIAPPSGSEDLASPAAAGYGKLSGSLDEFRYWKTQRSSKDIGRFWISQVGGGTNSDPAPFSDTQQKVNTDLGVYFKFNEGITGVTATDSTVLDYSGRLSNGSWTGYSSTSRNTGSAIVISEAAIKEFKDPIIHSVHPDVVSLRDQLILTGSLHDANNSALMYSSIPAWITEEDEEGQKNLKYLTQIMSSYFDTLHMQIDAVNKIKDVDYVSGSNKPLPFANKLLNTSGLIAPNIFLDADILQHLADRSEDKLYEKSLSDTKNIIYQNIYNNLVYIYKSKGTEKAFRNLIRCFGIDDELLKMQLYAHNTGYEFRENRRTVLRADRTINFNTGVNKKATVYSFYDSSNANSSGFISSGSSLTGGYAFTLEADILFPKKPDESSTTYFDTNAITSSLFGVHGAAPNENNTTWPAADDVNFQVFSVRDELSSPNVYFMLTGTSGGHIPLIASSLYEEVYDDTSWNLSVRIKPERYPLASLVQGADTGNYTVELHGVQVRSAEIINVFTVSASITSPPAGFITGSRRPFVGAHRQNFTGSTVYQTSDVKVDACRFWLDYVEDEALRSHALDTENFGAHQPSSYAFPFNETGSYGDITKADTLLLNWEFSQNTGSNASGQFIVADESSGSAALAASRYGALGKILNTQHTALGSFFTRSSTSAANKEFIASSVLNDLETLQPADTITVLSTQDQRVFKIDSRPINYFFAFEKSMSKVISEEMLNMFGTLKDFNSMVGLPVNRYRPDYKAMDFMRQKFFEKVGNDEIDFDKFYEFYKWFDSSLSYMLGQLVPASADFAENIRTIIENTALQRNKYKNVFPFIDALENVFEVTLQSNVDYGDAISSPDDDPQGTGLYPTHTPTKRQVGSSTRDNIGKWKYIHHPPSGETTSNYLWWKNEAERNLPALVSSSTALQSASFGRGGILQSIKSQTRIENARPYRYAASGYVPLGGVGTKPNKSVNFTFAATAPYGPLVTLTNIPRNIMLSFDTDVEKLLDTTDVFYPAYKQRLGFGVNPRINHDATITDKRDGNTIAPFSLYESKKAVSKYELKISSSYKPGVTITNLHHDFVINQDIPAQGPFTEKFVGGRYYRHTELNDGTDTRLNRAEGFRIELGLDLGTAPSGVSGALGIVPPNYPFIDTPFGGAPLGFLSESATAQRFRDETAKRPVNIKNILMTTASVGVRLSGTLVHSSLGNYQKNYQVVQTSKRSANDLFFREQTFSFALTPETRATRGREPLTVTSTANTSGSLDYTLPNRGTPASSNQTVIVNRFSSPGGYAVQSRGYLDPAHEEYSVYNASPYHNRGVIDYGLSGSASVDPTAALTLTVVDQISKNRGLNQRATLHAGRFGFDSAYGSVATINEFPSWHKTNRNTKTIIVSSSAGYADSKVYDNLFVQHAIPRSEQQYLWITSSLGQNQRIYGLDSSSCACRPGTYSELIVSGALANASFNGLSTFLIDPVSASTFHTLGFPLASDISSYSNLTLNLPVPARMGKFNILMTMRNGPYGYPMWKQLRTGDRKVAQQLRKENILGTVLPPGQVPDRVGGNILQYVRGIRPNKFVDYIEQPISSRYSPVTIYLEDNTEDPNPENNGVFNISYGNLLDYFSNEGLNNRLNTPAPNLYNNSLHSTFEYLTSSALSTLVTYSERLYPAEINAYRNIVRRRTEFTIDDIWNPSRKLRKEYGGKANSQGNTIHNTSIWPLDGHYNFAGTSSTRASDGAGELMNSYSRFSGSHTDISVAATYAMRVIAGRSARSTVFAGDAEWLAGSQAAKQPHEAYADYSNLIARVGKDHSIIPEFRISELIEDYVETNDGDYLADLNNIFQLTGASISDSSKGNFYKTYTNSDFLKYFDVIDDAINGKRSEDLKINRFKVSLKCSALLKFLPYKGFYPAERTLELATLFSRSYADYINTTTLTEADDAPLAWRTLLEPMYSPGIMYNTIKSGIAVGNFVAVSTGSTPINRSALFTNSIVTALPEGNIDFNDSVLALGTGSSDDTGWALQKIPFEAIYKPAQYFNKQYITGSSIYDTGFKKSALSAVGTATPGISNIDLKGKRLYTLAADNFLCGTTEFFKGDLTSFVSEREDNFKAVTKDTTYKMVMALYRTQDATGSVDRNAFEMYTRTTAFGAPVAKTADTLGNLDSHSASFSHVTPPYFAGLGQATFAFTATSSGVPTLDDILANTTITYARAQTVDLTVAADTDHTRDPRMQLDSCFNLTDYYASVPTRTNTQKKTWLIQSKFETPILNFAGVSYSTPPASTVGAGTSSADAIITRGMWHQYGSIPTATDIGVFAKIQDSSPGKSLAAVVGMEAEQVARIGSVKNSNTLKEAIIAVPFKRSRFGSKKFFKLVPRDRGQPIAQQSTYQNLVKLMDEYVFPPKFDFTRSEDVDAIHMYAFEFSAYINQQDIANMWQSLPPNIGESFKQKEVVVEEAEILKALMAGSEDIRWMVFKVKKRAPMNYEMYRRSLVTDNVGPWRGILRNQIRHSYNWPYDYFSLVELVKIDEAVQYVSADLTGDPDTRTEIVGDVNVNIRNPVTVADPGFDDE